MMPGNPQILACPFCGKEKKNHVISVRKHFRSRIVVRQ